MNSKCGLNNYISRLGRDIQQHNLRFGRFWGLEIMQYLEFKFISLRVSNDKVHQIHILVVSTFYNMDLIFISFRFWQN